MPPEAIGVLNSGSASIKFALFGVEENFLRLRLQGQIEGIYTHPHFISKSSSGVKDEKFWDPGVKLGHSNATEYLLAYLRAELTGVHLLGVGHRVVHGGVKFKHPVVVDREVLSLLENLIPLAPLHQPYNLSPIFLALERVPHLPQIACFDTEFHTTAPELSQMFGLPAELHAAGLRRYGFHGLSYEYISSILPKFDRSAAAGKCIILHLGNGASMSAVEAGRSVATTMGFTAVDGLPMGTRCGSLDPGVLLYLMDHFSLDARGIEKLIYQDSGLLGVSGVSSDMRTLLNSSEPRAKLAVDLFVYRIRREMGSLSASLGGVNAIVFTGGIGENSAAIRERVCQDAAWLGVELDEVGNAAGGPRISTRNSRVAAWVLPTNEELMIAQHTLRLLRTSAGKSPQSSVAA
jgi:acetate kinase